MKPATRKKIEAHILNFASRVDASGINTEMYRTIFKTLTDEQLDALCREPIPLYDPNGSKVDIDVMRNITILREMGYEPFQRAWLTDPKTGATSLTANKHLTLPLPVRRQTQLIEKKISYASHNRTTDTLTGQVTGASKSSAFSFPQTYVMFAKGYDRTTEELVVHRGGNQQANRVIDRNIRETGKSSQQFEGYDKTRTKSTEAGGHLFNGMHIGTNMGKVNK